MIYRKSRLFSKTIAGTSELESSAFWMFFECFDFGVTGEAGESYVQNFESFPGKKRMPQSEFQAESYARFKEDPSN